MIEILVIGSNSPVALEQSLQEKDTARKKSVVRFKRSDAQKDHQQQRRDQNRIHHGQPLPEPVHEHGHDQPIFQQHEGDDQKPPEVTLKVEVVNKIGRRAENKQQSPDLEIDADRMLLFFQAEDGIRDYKVTGVQTCALPI